MYKLYIILSVILIFYIKYRRMDIDIDKTICDKFHFN